MSEQPPPALTASAVGLCPTMIQTSRTPQHWKFTQHRRTTRPPPPPPPPHGIKKNGNCKRKSRVQKLANCTLRDLATKLDVHGRHCMLSYLSSLPISVLRGLDTEANKLYDRTNRLYDAALLTRCYTQHALRPVIDSKIHHIRHFIKIPFINKGMDFIDLPSIFRDKSVQSSIPNYFKNCEVPIICYKYNKPIRGAIFNFNKLVSDLDIETCTPDS